MHKIRNVATGALIALTIAGGAAVATGAGVASAATAAGGGSLSVSPTRSELHVVPGHTVTERVTIVDNSAYRMLMGYQVRPFGSMPNGAIAPVNSGLPPSVNGTGWVTVSPASFTLAPHGSRVVTVRITAPERVGPGQKYVGVLFTATSLTSSTGGKASAVVGFQAGVANELILDDPGVATHHTVFGLHAPAISWGGPITVTATVQNKGNSYALLNRQSATAGSSKILLPSALVLAGGSRTLTGVQASPPFIGIETVTYHGQSATVWILPGKTILITLGILAIVLAYVLFVRSHTRKRRHGRSVAKSRHPAGAGAHGRAR
jgi:hypothetical protein